MFLKKLSTLKMNREIAFVGGGNMARALAKGFVQSGLVNRNEIYVSVAATDSDNAKAWEKDGYNKCYISNYDLLNEHGGGIVFLCVKPYQLTEISGAVRRNYTTIRLIISVMAGISLEKLHSELSSNAVEICPLIRMTPNVASAVCCGATTFCADSNSPESFVDLTKQLMEAVGTCHSVKESQMNAAAALNGAGPAFIYTVIDALSDGGVHAGLPRDLAIKLAAQTALGAAQMLLKTEDGHPALFKDMVCSPGGTTISGIRVLEKAGVRGAFIDAVQAAADKAVALAAHRQ